jgi:hypothetical protein
MKCMCNTIDRLVGPDGAADSRLLCIIGTHDVTETKVMLVQTPVFEFFCYSSSRNLTEIRRVA